MYEVPLDDLYEVVASCQYNSDGEFCPVLLKIIDKSIKRKNGGLPFLLQVWNKRGDMIFERALEKPCCNWNISGDVFLFQEEPHLPEIYLLKLYHGK